MPRTPFDRERIDITCSDCGHKTPKSIAWLRNHAKLACPGCGAAIAIEAKQGLRELDKATRTAERAAQRALDRIGRAANFRIKL